MAGLLGIFRAEKEPRWTVGKVIGRLLDLILNVFFVLALVGFLSMAVTWAFHGFDLTQANVFGYTINPVLSGSMEPTIMTGDIVIAKRVAFEDVEVGDIVIYKHTFTNGKTVSIMHRVVEKYDDHLIMKGDNNETNDPWEVRAEDVRCQVILYRNK